MTKLKSPDKWTCPDCGTYPFPEKFVCYGHEAKMRHKAQVHHEKLGAHNVGRRPKINPRFRRYKGKTGGAD